jgi:epsilon-lactone hydrolase
MNGVPVVDIRPDNWTDNRKVLVYVHGGGYTMFSAHSSIPSSGPMGRATGLRTILVDYTVSPHTNWDVIQEQVISVFTALLAEGYKMKDIALYGDSAGVNIAAATVINLRDRGIGMPAAVVLWSPSIDSSNAGDTMVTLDDADPTIGQSPTLYGYSIGAYVGDLDRKDPRGYALTRPRLKRTY